MQKLLLLFIFLASFLKAAEIEWHKSYKDAYEASQKDQKMLMVLISSDDCKFCDKLKSETFTDSAIIEKINKSYNSVEVDKERENYPALLQAKGVPTVYFLTSEGSVIDYTLGYYNAEDFDTLLQAAAYRYKKMKEKR